MLALVLDKCQILRSQRNTETKPNEQETLSNRDWE